MTPEQLPHSGLAVVYAFIPDTASRGCVRFSLKYGLHSHPTPDFAPCLSPTMTVVF